MLSHSDDFHAATTAGATSAAGLASPTDSAGTVLSAEQVERQASLAPGNVAPRYPESLRNAGVEGRVMATFVVDVSGRAEDTTVRFARSDNGLFEDAVRGALRRMRFIPAEVGGRKVRQLVQMPFVFTLSR
jgi:protein TonB